MGRHLGVRGAIGLASIALWGGCAGEPEWASLFERQQHEDAGVRFADAGDRDWDARWDPDGWDAGGLWQVHADAASRDGCDGVCVMGDADAAGGAEAGLDGPTGDGLGAHPVIDAGTDGEVSDAAAGADARLPTPPPGGVVVTEVMSDPEVGAERYGEWIELYNPSPNQTVNLLGCELRDAGRDRHVIGEDLILHPESYVVLASSGRLEDLGFAADYVYGNFALANGEDEVILVCGADLIDEVPYGGPGPAPHAGVSLSLDPCQTSAGANDSGEAWCSAHHVYNPPGATQGDRGTPGQGNPPCAAAR